MACYGSVGTKSDTATDKVDNADPIEGSKKVSAMQGKHG